MREQPDFTERFENAVTNCRVSAELDRVERRRCASDNYDGVEYKFYGWFVPVRPLIDSVGGLDNFAIESMSYNNEMDEPYFQFFLADLREGQPHPAFTENRL